MDEEDNCKICFIDRAGFDSKLGICNLNGKAGWTYTELRSGLSLHSEVGK